jgi:PhoPQ-activated pathogenicity-related protein
MRPALPLAAAIAVMVFGAVSVTASPRQTGSALRAAPDQQTPLDRYVAAPDPHFAWKVIATDKARGVTATRLKLTSQQWLTEREVVKPIWTHDLNILRPSRVVSDIALLFITGGENDEPHPEPPPGFLLHIARDTGTIVAELRTVPNQPVVFQDDPKHELRSEDDFIAYTWNHFLRTGDDRWPARLPMTKSAVRAMDAVTAFCASADGGQVRVSKFVVAGASKRGWTTWTTAAVDNRVIAIAPVVIDMLNLEPSFEHHWQAYGAWAPAVKDYVDQGIMDWMGTPAFRALMRIEEPYEYRVRLTMPKLIMNASGDEFFLPDSSQFYIDQLPGETHLRYVPNASHGLEHTDAAQTLEAFYASIVSNRPRPRFTSSIEADGSLRVVAQDRPSAVRLWQATNSKARDFRLDTIGPAYRDTVLTPAGPNTWVARVQPPAEGWTAYFMELVFPSGGKYPLKLTTSVRVIPERMPFPARSTTTPNSEPPIPKRGVPQ